MKYWFDQPVKITESSDIEVRDIVIDPSYKKTTIPGNLAFKTITSKHFEIVHNFLNFNYIQDNDNILRLTYSKDFIYWYLKNINYGMAVALIHNETIIGLVTALFIKVKINDTVLDMPYINFLCVSKQLRNCNMAPILIDEIKKRICNSGINYALFTSMTCVTQFFCKSSDFIIPINYKKLIKIGFINEIEEKQTIIDNPLHLMKQSETNVVFEKLNYYNKDFKIKIIFDYTTKYLICTKKNIVYSFVKRNNCNQITDFINFYKYYYYCIESNQMISIAKLGFYFCETLTLTKLVEYLIDILPTYKIDQLCISDMSNNDTINITKYATNGSLYSFLFNIDTKSYRSNQVCLLPI